MQSQLNEQPRWVGDLTHAIGTIALRVGTAEDAAPVPLIHPAGTPRLLLVPALSRFVSWDTGIGERAGTFAGISGARLNMHFLRGGLSTAARGKGRSPPWAGCYLVHRGRQTVSPNPGRLLPLTTPISCGIKSVDITLINDITKLMRR